MAALSVNLPWPMVPWLDAQQLKPTAEPGSADAVGRVRRAPPWALVRADGGRREGQVLTVERGQSAAEGRSAECPGAADRQ